jgi:hypothetical protein
MNNPGIFLIQPNNKLIEMNEIKYEPEKVLQKLLAVYRSWNFIPLSVITTAGSATRNSISGLDTR